VIGQSYLSNYLY